MHVIDYEPRAWFLLAHGGALLLDVNCNHHALGYNWLIELDEAERGRFEQCGHAFIDGLATQIHNSVPILEVSQSPYKARNRDADFGAQVSEAIRLWRISMRNGAE